MSLLKQNGSGKWNCVLNQRYSMCVSEMGGTEKRKEQRRERKWREGETENGENEGGKERDTEREGMWG